MHDYIVRPQYAEKEDIRHYAAKEQRHRRSLEKHADFIRRSQENTNHQRERFSGISITDLPAEVIENILSYLVAPLSCYNVDPRPRDERDLKRWNGLSDLRNVLEKHPFYRLAETCQALRVAVEIYARHLLHRNKGILRFEVVEQECGVEEWRQRIQEMKGTRERFNWKEEQKDEKLRSLPPYRLMWVRWSYCRCLFCGKQTQRRAIFNHSLWTCSKCDKHEWPKMKRKDILSAKSLLPIHLDSPRVVFPQHQPQLNPPRAAYDRTHGLLYLKSDISALTSFVHDHDPCGSLSRAAQKQKDRTVILNTFDGSYVEIDTMMSECDVWSNLKLRTTQPEPRLSKAVMEKELIPEWQSSVISQAIATARELH